jgi:hypothetical protein
LKEAAFFWVKWHRMTLMQQIFADLIRVNPLDPRYPRAIISLSIHKSTEYRIMNTEYFFLCVLCAIFAAFAVKKKLR